MRAKLIAVGAIAATVAVMPLFAAGPGVDQGLLARQTVEAMNSMPYPPSFQGEWRAYLFALFSMFALVAMAIRRAGQIFMAMNSYRDGWGAPVTISRIIELGFLFVIILGLGPDVWMLLVWSEATTGQMQNLIMLNRIGDGLTIIPGMTALLLQVFSDHLITYQLIRYPAPVGLNIRADRVRHQISIILLILMIAGGVTLYK